MHAKFNLNPGNEKWTKYQEKGKEIHTKNSRIIQSNLSSFKNIDGVLQAETIIENWFPEVGCEVFLSHSHKDEESILGLAGWLYENFQITSFIDSAVWGYSDTLLKAIDDKYCLNPSGETYNYDSRNRSTSHVHMMLSTALMNMIDKTECIIFINTEHSFKPSDYLQDKGKTESPWIYSEIAMTRMLQKKTAQEHRKELKKAIDFAESLSMESHAEPLKIEYPADIYHLTNLNIEDLFEWENKNRNEKSSFPLDTLYELKRK